MCAFLEQNEIPAWEQTLFHHLPLKGYQRPKWCIRAALFSKVTQLEHLRCHWEPGINRTWGFLWQQKFGKIAEHERSGFWKCIPSFFQFHYTSFLQVFIAGSYDLIYLPPQALVSSYACWRQKVYHWFALGLEMTHLKPQCNDWHLVGILCLVSSTTVTMATTSTMTVVTVTITTVFSIH